MDQDRVSGGWVVGWLVEQDEVGAGRGGVGKEGIGSDRSTRLTTSYRLPTASDLAPELYAPLHRISRRYLRAFLTRARIP